MPTVTTLTKLVIVCFRFWQDAFQPWFAQVGQEAVLTSHRWLHGLCDQAYVFQVFYPSIHLQPLKGLKQLVINHLSEGHKQFIEE